ncbi:MAG: proline--tRNA ligase [Planctomycetota bacterium]
MSNDTTHPPYTNTRPGTAHRWTRVLIPTTREAPADAELPSHIMLSRAGYIRRVGAGIYDYLPLAKRVLAKIETIVREEMDRAGSIEMLMPAMEPIEFFKGTKRDVEYGDLLFKLEDRHGRVSALAPTHEEIITELMKASITSYKQMPIGLYQIQTKYRDEFRPRAGLLRCREFIMKDAYSFGLSIDELNHDYDLMYQAYVNVFTRCGLDFTVVEAESGPIGGSASHEFMVNAESGEDTILVCPESGYAANVEKCEIGERPASFTVAATVDLTKHHTPDMPGIEKVAAHLGTDAAGMLKTIVMQPAADAETEVEWVLAVVQGDHDVNEGKVRDAVGFAVTMGDEKAARAAGFAIGYVSPRVIAADGCKIAMVIDPDATSAAAWATGADEPDHHVTGFNWARDLEGWLPSEGPDIERDGCSVKLADVRNAMPGDPSPRAAGATLQAQRGIEVGHIFKLGTKYSRAFDFAVLDKQQQKQDVIMGCYGIGVSRTLAACVEQRHDDNGIIWPAPIAPYHVLIVLIKPEDEESAKHADGLAAALTEKGIDVLIDDRKERPGVKFKDADLIGIPARVTIGPKTIEQGGYEIKARSDEGKAPIIEFDRAIGSILDILGGD